MVESKADSRKIIFEKLKEIYKGADGKGNHKAKFLKQVEQYIEDGQLDKSFYGKFKDVAQNLISSKKIKEALDADEFQNKIEGNLKLSKQQKKTNEESEQEEVKEPDVSSQETFALTEDQKQLAKQLKKTEKKATRGQSPTGKVISEEKQQRRKQKEMFQQETQQKLQEVSLHQQELKNIVSTSLASEEMQQFVKLALVRAQMPDIAQKVLTNQEIQATPELIQRLDKAVLAVKKSKDPSAKSRANQLLKRVKKIGEKQYSSQSESSVYNSATSGIPKLEQTIAQPRANPKSANSTIAVNGSGFAGQKVIPEPQVIYNSVTGQVDASQYKDEKERFAKEVYYKTRNLHPEVRKRAEAVMKKLEQHYESRMQEELYREPDMKKDLENQIQEFKQKKFLSRQDVVKINMLEIQLQELNSRLKQPINPHVAGNERKPVQYPQFTTTAKQKEEIKQAGKVETLATQVQNQPMVSRFAKGLNDNPDAHTQNQMAQRDPGEVYNTSMKPDYADILPELKMIVEQQAQLEHADPEQLQQALSVLDDKDPFEVLFNLNFLNSKVAEIPITTKEQQRVRNEAEAIARKVGRQQVFYPYNKREIELLQGALSQYTDASGHVVPQPVRSKEYYEGLQKAEEKGVRKELEHLQGVTKEQTLEYLRQKQLEAEGSKGRERTKLNKEIAQLQKQLKELPEIKEGEEPQHGEVGIQQFVEFAHKLIKYVSKIEGDIDPSNNNLASYKTKTTVFTPVIKKKENAQFKFTTGSAFALRPC